MGNLHWAVASEAAAMDLLFVGLTTGHGYHRPSYYARLVPKLVYFQRFGREADN